MNDICVYSIYIRTLGKGGEKYQRLLNSIDSLTIRPKEVVIVLPYGYTKPKELLGYEKFAYSEKGMVRQRIFAINDVKTPYMLLLDDDVEFEPQYVEKIFATMQKADAQCCIPILKDNLETTRSFSKIKRWINQFTGYVIYKQCGDEYFMKINKYGGITINTSLSSKKQYYTQTGHGSNCFAESKALKDIHFENELWLEDSGYALPEDQVMFYKLFVSGYRIAVCQNVYFCHLDAASTNDGKRYLRIAQAKAGNNLIFWYRFVYLRVKGIKRLTCTVAIIHRIFWESFFYAVKCHNTEIFNSIITGLKYGLSYIKRYRQFNK